MQFAHSAAAVMSKERSQPKQNRRANATAGQVEAVSRTLDALFRQKPGTFMSRAVEREKLALPIVRTPQEMLAVAAEARARSHAEAEQGDTGTVTREPRSLLKGRR
jgi:hypothetical protein